MKQIFFALAFIGFIGLVMAVPLASAYGDAVWRWYKRRAQAFDDWWPGCN